MFQFRRFPSYAYFIQRTMTEVFSAGFPHSDIHGSKDICSSPWLFAACHVLRRLLMPRHSPCALSCLTCPSVFTDAGSRLSRIMQALFLTEVLSKLFYPFTSLTIFSYFSALSRAPLSLASSFLSFVQFLRCNLSLIKSSSKPSSEGFDQHLIALVGPSGLEPPTLRLSVVRSSQLSYGPPPSQIILLTIAHALQPPESFSSSIRVFSNTR